MIYKKTDPLTGAGRHALIISKEDAQVLGVRDGDPVEVRSDNGASMRFTTRIDRIKPRNVQAFWPECNPLIKRRVCNIAAGVPDYNAVVEIVPVPKGAREPVTVGAEPGSQGSYV